jgi:dCMP deaminase
MKSVVLATMDYLVVVVIPRRRKRPEKYFWFEHAERNAIYNAARAGIPLKGGKMYVTFLPCMDCARAIVQSGITTVVAPPLVYDNEQSKAKWAPHHERTMVLLRECGVRVRFIHEA